MDEAKGIFDKAKAAVGSAAGKAKEGVEDIQARLDLATAQRELGKAAFELIETGELEHPALEEQAARVRELRDRIEGEDDDDADGDAETAPELDADAEPESESVA